VVAGLLFCLLAAGRPIARRAATAAVLVVAFALPMVGYAAYNNQVHGTFALPSGAAARRLYARLAVSVTCSRPTLPAYERPLCPPPGTVQPKAGSLIEGYAQGSTSPLITFRPPHGEAFSQVLRDFVERAVRQQPLAVARSVGDSLLRPLLSWSRYTKPGELPTERWRFQPTFPLFNAGLNLRLFYRWGGYHPAARHRLAWLLRDYQLSLGYTPGLVLLACVILALAASLGIGRARHSGQRLACLLWLTAGFGLLLAASLFLFSWRYQLPILATVPPAAALGLSALTSPKPRHEPPPGAEEERTDPGSPDGAETTAAEHMSHQEHDLPAAGPLRRFRRMGDLLHQAEKSGMPFGYDDREAAAGPDRRKCHRPWLRGHGTAERGADQRGSPAAAG
jgi:hypothetical protein